MATLLAPRLAERYGWANTFGLAIAPILCVMIVFAWCAADSPRRRPRSTWRDYAFGGFIGFTSSLTTFFYEQYHVSRVSAGDFTTVVVVSGSLLRPFGGWLSDRIGGYRLLLALLAGIALTLGVVASLPPLAVVVPLLFVTLGLLGMGNGAVFQLVPQRFMDQMGIVTGIVGAAGELGGFFLPSMLGAAKDLTGSYAAGLVCFAAASLLGSIVLLERGTLWTTRWRARAVEPSGVFCYRGLVRSLLSDEAA